MAKSQKYYTEVGNALRIALKNLKLTQKQVADTLNIKQTTISAIVRGKYRNDEVIDRVVSHLEYIRLVYGIENGGKKFIPPPVTGYRSLTQAEVDLMNENKGLGEGVRYQVGKVQAFVEARTRQQESSGEAPHSTITSSNQAVEEALRHFQTAFMWLNRAVAAPTTLA